MERSGPKTIGFFVLFFTLFLRVSHRRQFTEGIILTIFALKNRLPLFLQSLSVVLYNCSVTRHNTSEGNEESQTIRPVTPTARGVTTKKYAFMPELG